MFESSEELEIQPDPTTGFHGNRQGYDAKNGDATFSRLEGVRNLARSDY